MAPALTPVTAKQRVQLLRWMLLARQVDDKLVSIYRGGNGGLPGGSVFTGKGQEALSAAAAMQLLPHDVYAPLIRDTAGRIVQGEPLIDTFRAHLGRTTGPMRGRDGNIHRGNVTRNALPMISHLGSSVGTIAGWLMGKRLIGEAAVGGVPRVGMFSLGDGAMNTGATHEGLNIIAVERLPVVIVVADNQLSYSTFTDRTYACESLIDRAAGYGMAPHTCDGTDADACLATCSTAFAAARAGAGPQLIVAKLLRLRGHGEHDDASYVPKALHDRFADCVDQYPKQLVTEGVCSAADIQAIEQEHASAINAALTQALSEPVPLAADEQWQSYARDLLTEHTS